MRIATGQQHAQALRAMLEQQATMARTQQQLATGQRILSPGDDPIGASRTLELDSAIAATRQHQRNADAAAARLGLEENTLTSAVGALQRARELAVAAGNGAWDATNLGAIATELRQLGDQLLGIANTRDATGEYLFAGYSVATRPFLRATDGAVTYAGDQGQRLAQIGAARTIPVGDSGDAVFMAIRDGNGSFATSAADTNTGTGVIMPGTLVDAALWAANRDQYTLEFVTNGAGELAYQIVGAASGQVVPAPPAVAPGAAPAYASGADIQFQGVQVRIEGAPAVGDRFQIAPSGHRDLFAMVTDLAAALEAPVDTPVERAAARNQINRALADLDRALEHLGGVRSAVGGRLNAIDRQRELNEDQLLRSQTLRSEVADLDYAEAVSRFSQQQAALGAAQQAYLRVQGLSLFDFLS